MKSQDEKNEHFRHFLLSTKNWQNSTWRSKQKIKTFFWATYNIFLIHQRVGSVTINKLLSEYFILMP